jgi:hypothetical protein
MALAFLHLIHILGLGALAAAYHWFPHLWKGQGVFFLTLATVGGASLSMVGIGVWAITTKASSSGKVALHAALALVWSAGIGFYAYRVVIEYHLVAYMRGKLGL